MPAIAAAYVVSMLFTAFCYYNAEVTYETLIYVLTGAVFTAYLILFILFYELSGKKKRIVQYVVIILAVVEMAVNGLYGFGQVGSSEPDYYYGDTKTFETLKSRVEEKDNSFCRSDILEPLMVDEATWYNLKSVGIFGSTVRGELVEIMGKLGFYTGANEYLYYGATPVTNALFGVKYVYTREGDFVNVDMEKYDTLDNGPFTVQNELCGALTGVEPVFVSIYDDLKMEVYGTNVDVSQKDDHNASYSNANGSARADMVFIIPRDMDLYVNCRASNVHKMALLIDGNEVAFDRYQGQIFHVGKMKEGQMVDIQFVLNEGEDLSGDLYCYPMEFLENQFLSFYDILAKQGMRVEKFSETKIEGSLSVQQDGVFMTSIPYDEGWDLYVDGKKADTCMLLEGFLGAKLDKGDYKIKLVYHCPGLSKGLITTIFGIIVFYLICRFEKRIREGILKARQERIILKEGVMYEKESSEKSSDTGSRIGNTFSSGDEGNSEGNAANS